MAFDDNGNDYRPTGRGEANAVLTSVSSEAIRAIEGVMERGEDLLQAGADALAGEAEDKGFWGSLATWGTTVACSRSGGTIAGCTALGTLAGSGARGIVDLFGDAEESIPTSDEFETADTLWYRDQQKSILEDLNEGVLALEDYNRDEWKLDLSQQLSDSLSAMKMSGMLKTVIPEVAVEATATATGDTSLHNIFTDLPDISEAFGEGTALQFTSQTFPPTN